MEILAYISWLLPKDRRQQVLSRMKEKGTWYMVDGMLGI